MTYDGHGEVSAVLRRAADHGTFGRGPMTGTVVVDVDTTNGRYSLYRIHLQPRAPGAQPHFHRTFAESFYVVDGVVEWFNGDTWIQGGAGDHVYIPEGGIHGFRNRTDDAVAMLMMTTPGIAREDYFREMQRIAASGEQLTDDEWTAVLARYDQYMV